MRYNRVKITTKTLLLVGTSVLLAACGAHTPGQTPSTHGRIDSALQKAATNAAATGQKKQSLAYLEKMYKRSPDDAQIAVDYAAALREADYLDQATTVLAPLANDSDGLSAAKTEYAALMLAKGDYAAAEKYAQKAVLQNDKDARAYQYLGISLDAREMYEEGERAYRKGLEHWEGDPTVIMNNLALNLASQEFFEEAVEILRKAQTLSPNKIEIERNLRIVTALQQSATPPVAKPAQKPKATKLNSGSSNSSGADRSNGVNN